MPQCLRELSHVELRPRLRLLAPAAEERMHGGRTYDQCHADSLRDGVSDRVMRFV